MSASARGLEPRAPTFTPREWDSGPPVERARFALWLFLGSEALFFAALISAHVVLRASAPPEHAPLDVRIGIGLSLLLALSSILALSGVRRLTAGRRVLGSRLVLGAALCCLAFLALQALEWSHLFAAGMRPNSSLFGSSFFVLTGAHGLHVLAGATWLAISALGARRSSARTLPVELATLYQNFVDMVWFVLFVLLYLT